MRRVFSILVVIGVLGAFVSGGSQAGTTYAIKFKVSNAACYDSLDFTIDYSAANGAFLGAADAVQCTTNATLNATGVYNHVYPNIRSGMMRLTTFAGPVVLVTCDFYSFAGTPTANQFVITVRDWTPATSPSPTIVVSSIQ